MAGDMLDAAAQTAEAVRVSMRQSAAHRIFGACGVYDPQIEGAADHAGHYRQRGGSWHIYRRPGKNYWCFVDKELSMQQGKFKIKGNCPLGEPQRPSQPSAQLPQHVPTWAVYNVEKASLERDSSIIVQVERSQPKRPRDAERQE